MKTYSPPIKKTCRFFNRFEEKRTLNDFCGPFKSEKNCLVHERRGRKSANQKVKKAILTGKVAREKKHHGEDDQKRDVCLQDSCEWRKKRRERTIDWKGKEKQRKGRKKGSGSGHSLLMGFTEYQGEEGGIRVV